MSDDYILSLASKGVIRSGNNSVSVALSQVADIGSCTPYTFGESTIEVDFMVTDDAQEGHPFARVDSKRKD